MAYCIAFTSLPNVTLQWSLCTERDIAVLSCEPRKCGSNVGTAEKRLNGDPDVAGLLEKALIGAIKRF